IDGELNYRTDPSTGGDVIEVLADGTEGAILDGPVYADGYTWYQLGVPGYGPDGETPGWVAGEYLAQAE
ncbi:MAG: SH3 domain-containing protein, partial [Thermomicrobiales bacterium]|nr:SH3 domain-containing protein [Thermomicrobiales bacterium]